MSIGRIPPQRDDFEVPGGEADEAGNRVQALEGNRSAWI